MSVTAIADWEPMPSAGLKCSDNEYGFPTVGREVRSRDVDARANRQAVARDDEIEILSTVERAGSECVEGIAPASHVSLVDEPVGALGVAVRDAVRAVPVVSAGPITSCT